MALTVALTDPGKEPYSNYKDHYRKPIDPLSPKLEGAGLQHQGAPPKGGPPSISDFGVSEPKGAGFGVTGVSGLRSV